jgi:hypothetical protein
MVGLEAAVTFLPMIVLLVIVRVVIRVVIRVAIRVVMRILTRIPWLLRLLVRLRVCFLALLRLITLDGFATSFAHPAIVSLRRAFQTVRLGFES